MGHAATGLCTVWQVGGGPVKGRRSESPEPGRGRAEESVEIVTGREQAPLDAGAFAALRSGYARLLIDLGSGDGAFPYRVAGAHPDWLCLGIDAHPGRLAEYARRARRKPARGGRPNVLYLAAPVERLPGELQGSADLLTINYPWAGLLEALLAGDAVISAALGALLRPPAALQILLNADAPPPGSDAISPDSVRRRLAPALARHGLTLHRVVFLPETVTVPTTWGARLIRGSGRRTLRVVATHAACPSVYVRWLAEAIGLPDAD